MTAKGEIRKSYMYYAHDYAVNDSVASLHVTQDLETNMWVVLDSGGNKIFEAEDLKIAQMWARIELCKYI